MVNGRFAEPPEKTATAPQTAQTLPDTASPATAPPRPAQPSALPRLALPSPAKKSPDPTEGETKPPLLDRLKAAMRSAKVLTQAEATSLRAPLEAALPQVWEAIDEFITLTTRNHKEAVIWQTIDDEDNKFIASLLIRSGVASPVAAVIVRQVVYKAELLRLGMITWPRFKLTIDHYSRNGGFTLPWLVSLVARNG